MHTDFNDKAQVAGLAVVREQVLAATAVAMRYKLLTPEQVASLPLLLWLIKGLLPRAGIGAIYGPSGSGKTFIVLDLVMALAAGGIWFGNKIVGQCAVTYCALEGQAGVTLRMAAYRKKFGDTGGNVRILLDKFDLRSTADIEDLVVAIKAAGGTHGVIILDTLNAASPGSDENSSADMGEMIAAAKLIQERLGALVLLVHHTGKAVQNGLRGHSSLLAALDVSVEVTRDGGRRSWKLAKSKDGQDGEEKPFTLEIVELGLDDDGDPITSCVVLPDDEGGLSKIPLPRIPKAGNQKIVWDVLVQMLADTSLAHDDDENRPELCPFHCRYIEVELAIEKICTRLPVEPRRQRERTRQAMAGLINRGLLAQNNGYLWQP